MHASRYLMTLLLLLLCNLTGGVCPADAAAAPGASDRQRVLFIVSSSRVHGTSTLPASVSFGEVVHAWDTFRAAGYAVDFVSPEGGEVPILDSYVSDDVAARLQDATLMTGLRKTATPAQIDPARYRAVYYVGGSNAMYGVPENTSLQRIAVHVYEQGGVVSAVCHGTAGIVNLRQANGQSLLAGKRITGFPEQHEEQEAAYFKQFPFLIGQTVLVRGGLFSAVDSESPYVQVDGRVVTGQNYASAKPVAEAVVALLAAQSDERQAVDQVMQTFMRAYETSDPKLVGEVFRTDGTMIGYSAPRGPLLMSRTGAEFATGFNGTPADDEDKRERSYEIVDIADDLAAVRVNLDYPGWDGVDYLVLLKADGRWQIASKTWTGKVKPLAP